MHRIPLTGRVALGVIAFLFLLPGQALARDRWYSDLYGHWAQSYIRVLWEEDVADGTPSETWWGRKYAEFFPDQGATRGEFAMMASKVFRLEPLAGSEPAFVDVPPGFQLYRGTKEAYSYIQAAWKNGLVFGVTEGAFKPRQVITREQSVAILIRGLGLGAFAQTLSDDDVSRQFSRFWDGRYADPSIRRELAVAIKLQILRGYPDGSLRLRRGLTRAEAATLLYRSCLIIPEANPNPFSPDGDAVDDATSFKLMTLKNRNTKRWELSITDYTGSHSLKNLAGWDQPPESIPWDGTDSSGNLLPVGSYFYQARAWDREGNQFSSVLKPITLERRSLTAELFPEVLPPGGELRLAAQTTGTANSVRAAFSSGDWITLVSSYPTTANANVWGGSYRIPPGTPDGVYTATFRAGYTKANREVSVNFRVFEPVTITGDVLPNPAKAGQEILVRAYTSPNIRRVTGRMPGGRAIDFRQSQPDRWVATYVLPPDLSEGIYQIDLRGYTATKEASTSLSLIVRGSILGEVNIFLSD